MSVARCMSCLWPGLPQLWRQGSWAGLAAALSWGLLANWLLAATFVWSEVAHPQLTQVGWIMLASTWMAGIGLSIRWNRRISGTDGDQRTTDLLSEAQIEYLRGNWLVAEAHLKDIVASDSTDVEAQLMLASLYRHTGRKSKAAEHLHWLERLTASRPWAHEIETEWRLLNELDDSGVVAPDDELPIKDDNTTTQNDFDSNNNEHSQLPAAA